TTEHTHCGDCSQCIDRRFAVLAARQEGHDPAAAYAIDLLAGDRSEGRSRTLLAAYLETAEQVAEMTATRFLSRFGEVYRALPVIDAHPDTATSRVFELDKRHAREVNGVIERAIADHSRAIRRRELPGTSLLRVVYDDGLPEEATPTAPQPQGPSTGREPRNW